MCAITHPYVPTPAFLLVAQTTAKTSQKKGHRELEKGPRFLNSTGRLLRQPILILSPLVGTPENVGVT